MGSTLLRAGRKARDFIEQMEGLVRLCSAKRINIKPGLNACTNGVDTIYLPWLPNDATEDQILKFFGFAAHEQAHFYGASIVKDMSKNKTRHHFENAMDDIRCENLQEVEYPGLKEYRKQFYRLMSKESLSEHMATATKKDLLKFIHAVLCYMISTVRYEQLEMDDAIEASPAVIDAYNKYVRDLVPRIKSQRTFKQSLELGGILYDRMKDMIREEMESRTPPPPKPEPKETEDDTDEDRSSDGGSSAEDSSEGSDKESSDKADDDSVRDDKSGESYKPEAEREDAEPSGEDSDSDPEESPDREGDTEDQGGEGSPDKSSEDMDSPEEPSESEGADGDRGEHPEDAGDRYAGPDSEADEPAEAGSSAEDSGDSEKTETEGVDDDESTSPSDLSGDTESGDPSDASEDGDSEAGDSGEPGDADSAPSGSRGSLNEGDTPEDEPDTDVDPEEPDPFGEYEDAKREWEEKIVEAVRKALDTIEENADEIKTITEEAAADIDELADRADAPYMVNPAVKDHIGYKEESPLYAAEQYRDQGITLLGAAGSRLTRLFVGLSKPKALHNRFDGRFDMKSFVADPLDRRFDVYRQKIMPKIDKAAVSFMIDNSSSMNGQPITRSYQILSAMLLYLNRAMIPTEAVGFTADTASSSRYRDCPVYLQIVKKFEDPYDRKVLQRCTPPDFMYQNAEVDCLRWMVPRLYARPEKKKVLFILGDGAPEIGNYMLNAKLAKAYREYVQLCRQAGIIVFGFGIGCDLSWVFGDDYISVDSSDMGDKIIDKLTEVLNRPRQEYSLERAAA